MLKVNQLSVPVVLLFGLSAFACSDDPVEDGGSGGGANSGGSGGAETDAGTGGTTEPDAGSSGSGGGGSEMCGDAFDSCSGDTPFFDDATTCCISAEDATALCIEQTLEQDPNTSTDDPTCGAGCTCTNCQQQMIDCGNDPAGYCPVIVACANRVGCTGVGCYAEATCMAEIDAAPEGGLGSLSVGLATELSDCVSPPMGTPVCEPTCL